MRLAGRPEGDIATPAVVLALADGRAIEPVWVNELDGVTFQIGDGDDRRFVKWAPAGSVIALHAEAVRLRWAVAYAPVPVVLDAGEDARGAWLLTAGLRGASAVADRWRADPDTAVRAIAEGLRFLHDALPVERCPFDTWVAHVAWPDEVPPVDQLVVCHGDACVPNILIGDDGRWSGHVDLEALGVGDRWADLAIATMSLDWNYGSGWQPLLLETYGVEPDEERIRQYRMLWNATP